MTRAVRLALAASIAALALGASGGAFAAGCTAPSAKMVACLPAVADATPVLDLTKVYQGVVPVDHLMPLAIIESDVGDVVIDNADPISEVNFYSNAVAISGNSSSGSVEINNQETGALEAVSLTANATAIEGYASGYVHIDNAGDVFASSDSGDAIGIYGYSLTGDVSIHNSGNLTVDSTYGLADGIFASGANVDVVNSAVVVVGGYTWAAGIEAQGSESTTVTNTGDINVTAPGFYQASVYSYLYQAGGVFAYAPGVEAFGIYATGGEGGVTVGNTGNIDVQGGYVTGIEVQSQGDIAINNSGGIVAGNGQNIEQVYYYDPIQALYTYVTGTQVAIGINASSDGEGAIVSVTNSGDITAEGIFGATGISATASGTGGAASISNTGSIYASQANINGYGAYGILASADGDASIDNGGSIEVYSAGGATGLAALSFAGDASVINTSDVKVSSTAFTNVSSYGIVSFAQNGTAYVGNSGNIDVATLYIGVGIDASGLEGTTVVSSGDIAIDGYRALGIRANSGVGDVSVTNSGSIYATYSSSYGYDGTAYGIFATSAQGDVSVNNSGDIDTNVGGNSVGVFGQSSDGDVSVSNSGSITTYSYGAIGAGIFARADNGLVSVGNTGLIDVQSKYGDALGVLARGGDVVVESSGDISADGFNSATGIAATSYYGSRVTTTGGSINVIAVGEAIGIDAQSLAGDVMVSNASSIDASGVVTGAKGINGYASGDVAINNSGDIYAGSLYGDSFGIYGYSVAGDVSIGNSGELTVISYYGLADGIFASGANVDVTNSGAIGVYGYTWSAGIEAQGADSTTVTNSGDISALAPGFSQVSDIDGNVVSGGAGAKSYGIYATAGEGGLTIGNSGDITVDGGYATGIEAQSTGDITVTNSGDIVAGSALATAYDSDTTYTTYTGTQVALGINATSNGEGAAVGVTNSGDITTNGIFGASGIAATSGGYGGTASVQNSGSIFASVDQKYGYGAYGIVSSADGDATVNNMSGGEILVYSAGAASGATALSFAGNASVTNAGDITVTNTAQKYYNASGIVSFAQNGEAFASNSGAISATSGNVARAIDATGFAGSTVVNSGSLYANAKYAYGVYASSGTGDVSVTNAVSGSIEAYSVAGRGFGVFALATLGDVMAKNAGSIEVYAYGQSAGVFGVAFEGNTTVTNSGSISVVSGGNTAVGLFGRADLGTVSINNSGDIIASDFVSDDSAYTGYAAYGVLTRGAYATVTNSGSILAEGNYYASGIAARSDEGTTVVTTATSAIEASATLAAIGIEGRSENGNVSVANAGSILAEGTYGAVGIQAYSGAGNIVSGNAGHIVSSSEMGIAIGETGYALLGNTTVNNSGMIEATGYMGAYGMFASAPAGTVTMTNSGHITATSPDTAFGIMATAYGNLTINNSGDVKAIAVGDDANVAAIQMGSLEGTATLNNSGKLSVTAPLEGQVAVLGSDGVEVINNTGHIYGSLVLLGGDDRLNNNSGGVWHVDTHSTDFGDGDDAIVNNAGGLIKMTDGAIHMGSGNDNIVNFGVIKVAGSGNLIDMGAGNLGAFTNVNNINFLDADTGDVLNVTGNMGGTGSLGLDVNLATKTSDQLNVNGNMLANAVQHVDIMFNGMPTTAQTSVVFAHVSGTSVAGNFVPGQILGYNYPRNFLDLRFGIGSQINTANTAADVFSINLDVAGLLDSGTLAANVASGAAGMLNAQVGTLRQRLGVNPYGDAGKVLSAFVRFYNNEGDVAPTHMAANFGQGGNFAYDFSTWGREVGVNANLFSSFHAGVTIGSADGRQRLTGAGIGQNRMDGMTWGAYATWFAPQGFYVDVSGRWMAVDVNSTSAAGNLQSRAHTSATNLEAGYLWTTANGFMITPQMQYTRTKVDGIKTIIGDRANFEGRGGTSSRGRLGVEFSKTFQSAGGLKITPYGAVNAVREFDGKMDYTVSNNFFGTTGTKGTSAMVDVGLGLQKGGWGVTAGANWVDGGALKSVVGSQVLVRFAW